MTEDKRKKLKKIMTDAKIYLVVGSMLFSMSGCSTEVSSNNDVVYDVIDTTNNDALKEGIEQIINIPGENFKLKVLYKCELQENERWMVTSDKKLNMEICTIGLPTGCEVYIDNIHVDTTICSYFPLINGITQDTMDDRIHNAQMLGFPISNTNSYYGINQIEGQNETFIKGSYHGFTNYSSGTIEERRRKESDYLEKGVYANKISSIIDLIIIDEDGVVRTVSVPSEIQVSVWPFIKRITLDGEAEYLYYYFDIESQTMKYDELSEEEFLIKTKIENQLTRKLD